ncbi:hypothetical protein PB1_11689 [Bacillus methanolicus PB1]|uniref:Uncharacterized protein n=1 Tax=Bacillus methanolicus PB1 TaxID=997296 RepID=I3DVE9_BACMT|nr:hypothetical protein PB1_11689 [Bacillus methanolicus PB1]
MALMYENNNFSPAVAVDRIVSGTVIARKTSPIFSFSPLYYKIYVRSQIF